MCPFYPQIWVWLSLQSRIPSVQPHRLWSRDNSLVFPHSQNHLRSRHPQPGALTLLSLSPSAPAAPPEPCSWESHARSQQNAILTPLIKFTTVITSWDETSSAEPQLQRCKISSCTNMERNKQIIHNQRLHRACLLSQMQTRRNAKRFCQDFLWKTCPGWCTGCSRWEKGIWVDVRVQQKAEDNQWMVLSPCELRCNWEGTVMPLREEEALF